MHHFYCDRLERFANGRIVVQQLLLDKLMAASSYLTNTDNITLLASEHGNGNSYLVHSQKDAGIRYAYWRGQLNNECNNLTFKFMLSIHH